MKKKMSMAVSIVLCLSLLMSLVASAASWPATSNIKTYVISTGNDTTVYETATSTAKYGTIYATDLITIKGYSGSRFYVVYPTSKGDKPGYIPMSAVTSGSINVATATWTATASMTAYRRSSGSSTIGSVSKGDKCYSIATSGSRTQIIYPISGGWKMGWVNTSSVPTTSSNTESTVSVSTGTYYIQAGIGSNKVLDVAGVSTAEGANIHIWDNVGGENQKFKITKSGSYYTITAVHSGKVLDVAGAGTANGTNVQQYTSNGTNAQKWQFVDAGNGYYYIKSALGKYLDVSGAGTANGTNVQIYEGNKTNAQKWKLVKVANTSLNVTSTTSTVTDSGWQYPVKSYSITQKWNNYSSSMAQKGRPYHLGIDIVSSNTAIYAAADGTVVYKGYSSGNGYHVILSHKIGNTTVKTLYSHLSSYSDCPAEGKSVSKGAKIGVMGNTGNSTGTHLHFAIFQGSSNDPYGYGSISGSNKTTYSGCTFYDPAYVIKYSKLP